MRVNDTSKFFLKTCWKLSYQSSGGVKGRQAGPALHVLYTEFRSKSLPQHPTTSTATRTIVFKREGVKRRRKDARGTPGVIRWARRAACASARRAASRAAPSASVVWPRGSRKSPLRDARETCRLVSLVNRTGVRVSGCWDEEMEQLCTCWLTASLGIDLRCVLESIYWSIKEGRWVPVKARLTSFQKLQIYRKDLTASFRSL